MDQNLPVKIHILVSDFNDPYWGQVLEGMYQSAQKLGVNLVDLYENLPYTPSADEETALLDELLAQNIDLLIDWGMPNNVTMALLDAGMTLVNLAETNFTHPRSISPIGLYDAARMAGQYIAQSIDYQGNVMVVGGQSVTRRAENGQSRVKGILDELKAFPRITVEQIPSGWSYAEGYAALFEYLEHNPQPVSAIFGLSDMLASGARDAAEKLGRLGPETRVVGINGDPFALAAIAVGKISATIETSGMDLGRDAVDLAYHIALGHSVPAHYSYKLRLVTAANIHQVSAEKLISIAELPHRLVRFNYKIQHETMLQLEASLEINRRVGGILNLKQLSQEIAELIRSTYGYDEVELYRCLDETQMLVSETGGELASSGFPLSADPALAETLRRSAPLFIAHLQPGTNSILSSRLSETHSRLVLPVHFSQKVTHLLDLRSQSARTHTRRELIGLQSLADQFGIAIRNAELYDEALHSREEALKAKARAESADNLKTRLLANVSHELRTPLNLILGYSQIALSDPNPYGLALPERLRGDLGHIHESGEHLIRLINDLLDLSRAEINELVLYTEAVSPYKLIREAFESLAGAPGNDPAVTWQLELPEYLPALKADPLRLRQILLNLLSNARKFTRTGEIVLGVEVSLPHLHLWVKDTGDGIPAEMQERIFEPFVTAENATQRREGIGLGLTITRRLVALHGGSLTLESQAGRGSTFHIYLPLPSLSDESLPVNLSMNGEPVALLISHNVQTSPALLDLCARQGLKAHILTTNSSLEETLKQVQPRVVAWDTTHAIPGDWALIQKLRSHPQICQLPFLLYGSPAGTEGLAAAGLTNVLLKPVHGQTLLNLINSLQPERASGTILIVDDDPGARTMYQSMLDSELPGFEVVSLAGGAAALDYLGRETPSLIILDLMMPDVDGFKVLEAVRSQPRTTAVPVLVLSGQVLSYEDARRLSYDRVLFQTKDVLTPAETAGRLQQALSGADLLPQPTSELVKQALAFIHQNYDRTFSLQEITQAVGVSKSYFSQIFRDEMGLSLWDYLNRFRVQKARELLRATSLPITEIALRVGFDDFSYFGRVFSKQCGCSPRAYRQGSKAG